MGVTAITRGITAIIKVVTTVIDIVTTIRTLILKWWKKKLINNIGKFYMGVKS